MHCIRIATIGVITLMTMFLYYLFLIPLVINGHVITDYLQDIRAHKDDVDRIMEYTLCGPGKHQTYTKVANITDMFGGRLSGSQVLEDAADYLLEMMRNEGLENVHSEPVLVPHWVRGDESVKVLQPRALDLTVMGLGGSVGTNGSDVVADVIVVQSFEELEQRQNEVAGKIVVYNQNYETYFKTVKYRTQGASHASKYGAVAVLVKTITDFSIYSPHTGTQMYWKNVPKIPALCITVEDAETFNRWEKAGLSVQISISSTSQDLGMTWSKNVMAEIVGTEYPDQVVVFGGHLDSWDVASGAMDDAGEVIMSWQVLSIVKALGLRPKRTMRMVAWTAEEVGLHGAKAYHKKYRDEANTTSLMMESDYGLFTPERIHFQAVLDALNLPWSYCPDPIQCLILKSNLIRNNPHTPRVNGLEVHDAREYSKTFPQGITGSQEASDIIQAISDLLGQSRLPVLKGDVGADIGVWVQDGIPTLSLETDHTKYFYYHHSKGDTVSVYTPEVLDQCTLVWTALAYVVADLDILLPRVTSEEYHHMQHDMAGGGVKATGTDDVTVICVLLAVSSVYRYTML